MEKRNIFLFGILAIHVIFVIFSMNQPFHGDEVVFVESAKGILKTGKPVFDYSAFKPNFIGLWHSPLYAYILSVFIFIFGESIYSVRAVSALFNIFTIVLVYLITRKVLEKNKNNENWALLTTFIYALNPLTVQSSVIIDIDGGILNFAVYLFLYLFIKNKNFYYLIPSLLFVFLAKENVYFILFLVFFVYCILTFEWKKIPKIIFLFLIAGVLFVTFFWIYCSFLGLDFSMPFKHNFSGFGDIKIIRSDLTSWAISAWSFKTFFYFAVPFFVILFFIFTFSFYYSLTKNKYLDSEQKPILLLNVLSIISILVFFYLGVSCWGFPKYYIIALPGMSIFLVYMLSQEKILRSMSDFPIKNKNFLFCVVLIALFDILLVYFQLFVQNPLIPEFDSAAVNTNIFYAIKLISYTFVLYTVVPFFICFFILCLFKFKRKVLVSLIFLTFFMFLYLNLTHAFANYSTYSKYGDKGILEVVNYFNSRKIPPNEITTHMHLGKYLGISDYYEITFAYNNEKDFKEKIIDNKNIKYLVIWERDIGRIGKKNMGYFYLKRKIGSYYIFKKRSS